MDSSRHDYEASKKYYKGVYDYEGGMYVRCLSRLPLLSACAIHLFSPLLRAYLRRKHST